ncbi:C-signal isoform X2 [Stomoxys calcitrans]|uniref:C-factor n=1 Tax=Stomoxys calcitrans TaxID=35570 RepID=A0A1I8NP05_STOCA|nr:C-signal isoform X2 [Stomoxys calcitrans]
MNSILITGCNRGLGLGLVKALVKLPKPPQHLFATCRNKDQAKELQDLAAEHPCIHIIEIDLNNFEAYDDLVKQIDDTTQGCGLNVLFNNAAIAYNEPNLDAVKADQMMNTFKTNSVVPVMLTIACLPLIKKASEANNSLEMGLERAAIINMSSSLGSISTNTTGGFFTYRCSKAALNAATKSFSIELLPDKILCVALHPGWVRTEMGGPNAPMEINCTTEEIVNTVMKFNKSHHGGFYQHDGVNLPW